MEQIILLKRGDRQQLADANKLLRFEQTMLNTRSRVARPAPLYCCIDRGNTAASWAISVDQAFTRIDLK
jgi:hypothetical protein